MSAVDMIYKCIWGVGTIVEQEGHLTCTWLTWVQSLELHLIPLALPGVISEHIGRSKPREPKDMPPKMHFSYTHTYVTELNVI